MIIIRMQGGLGNQMFQYVIGLAIKNAGYNDAIKYDISSYFYSKAHTGYSLKKYFGLNLEIAFKSETQKIYPYEIYGEMYYSLPKRMKQLHKIFYRLVRVKDIILDRKNQNYLCVEPGYVYNGSLMHLNQNKNIYLSGFFQNTLYFENLRKKICSEFQFARKLPAIDQELSNQIINTNSVAIHVRRGDYLGTGYDLCGMSYFKDAINKIDDFQNRTFYIFTDDRKYAEKNFTFLENFVVCSHLAEDCDFDLRLMTLCKAHIISNSSFSFWGAYLSQETNQVIAPQYWYNDGMCLHEFNLPKWWIRIDNMQMK